MNKKEKTIEVPKEKSTGGFTENLPPKELPKEHSSKDLPTMRTSFGSHSLEKPKHKKQDK